MLMEDGGGGETTRWTPPVSYLTYSKGERSTKSEPKTGIFNQLLSKFDSITSTGPGAEVELPLPCSRSAILPG